MKTTRVLISLAMILLIVFTLSNCKKDEPAPEVIPKLGETYQGGIVFYLDGTAKHGLIAAASDQSVTDAWWNGSFVETGATSATNGSANTTSIISAQGNTGIYAAKLCRDYRGGGFSDWFLPAKDQLATLYSQKTLVGGFTTQIYWTSTEESVGSVWVQDFETGEQHLDNPSDGANVHTRAIRAF
jgi:hypothetical protein